MTCREAQDRLFTTGSVAPGATEPAVAAHLGQCAGCRKLQTELAAALGSWRSTVASTPVPEAEREWLAVRRRLRGDEGRAGASSRPTTFARWALPVGALAAAAVALFVAAPPVTPSATPPQDIAMASAESVEAPGDPASTMVFVDEKSGWLIVWASDTAPRRG